MRGGALELQLCLGAQAIERLDTHRRGWLGCDCERVDRADASLDEPCPLRRAHAGDQQQVTGTFDLGLAPFAPPACAIARVAPFQCLTRREPLVDHRAQPRPLSAKYRHDVVDSVRADRAVTKEQLDGVCACNAEPVELVDIRRELHEGRDARGACELAVLHHVAPIRLTHDEVGKADELFVGKGGLEHDIDAGCKGGGGRVDRGAKRGIIAHIRLRNFDHPTGVTAHEIVEDTTFMRVTEFRGSLEHRVFWLRDRVNAPQRGVELAQHGELAMRCRRQIAGARDDAVVVDVHALLCLGSHATGSPRHLLR